MGAPAAHRVPSLDPAGHVVLTDTGHDASVGVQAVTAYSGRCPAKDGDGRNDRQAARRVARLRVTVGAYGHGGNRDTGSG